MTKYCPLCNAEITTLNYTANYSETSYGTSNGTYDIENEDYTTDDQECNENDNYEENEYEYTCPECSGYVNPEELLDLDPTEDNENPVEYNPENDEDGEVKTIYKKKDEVKFNKSILIEGRNLCNNGDFTTCPECKTIIILDDNSDKSHETIICPKCNKEIYA